MEQNYNDIYLIVKHYRNRIAHLGSGVKIDRSVLLHSLKIMFPEINIDSFSKLKEDYKIVSIIRDVLLRPEMLSWFKNSILFKSYKRILIMDEEPNPIWSFLANFNSNDLTYASSMQDSREVFKYFFPNSKVLTLSELDKSIDKYDLIISNSPYYGNISVSEKTKQKVDLKNGQSFFVSKSVQYITKGMQHLANEGTQITFSINTRTLFNEGLFEVFKNVFNLKGVFQYPNISFYNNNFTINPEILYISNDKPSMNVFVGIVGDSEEQQKDLLRNFKKNISGKSVLSGKIIHLNEFVSVINLQNKEKYEILARYAGGKLVPISDLIVPESWKRFRPEDIDFKNIDSSVFIPIFGKQPAVTKPSDIISPIQNTYHFQVKTDLIIPDYFAHILNQEVGYQLRINASINTVHQSLNKELFLASFFPLISIKDQIEILNLNKKLCDAIFALNTFKSQLWKKPSKYFEVSSEYKNKFKEPLLDEWIELLPFPLASILKGYYAKKDVSKKYEYLFLFFEALAEYLATLLLSSFSSDKEYFSANCEKIIGFNSEHKDWYLKSDFGGWCYLYSHLSKSARTLWNEKDNKEIVKNIFSNPSEMFINNLTNKKISEVLLTVNEYRNSWKGHGGITSNKIYEDRVKILEEKLFSINKLLINGFDDCNLYLAGKLIYKDGMFEVEVKNLRGSHSIFKDENVKSSVALEENKQYLFHNIQNRPIKVLPFIKILSSPSSVENACYFYNRIEKNKQARLVSYHFDGQPEQSIDVIELIDALNLLNPQLNFNS